MLQLLLLYLHLIAFTPPPLHRDQFELCARCLPKMLLNFCNLIIEEEGGGPRAAAICCAKSCRWGEGGGGGGAGNSLLDLHLKVFTLKAFHAGKLGNEFSARIFQHLQVPHCCLFPPPHLPLPPPHTHAHTTTQRKYEPKVKVAIYRARPQKFSLFFFFCKLKWK